jgi:glyoxylase-like metal-dependent hydrolase (beta-lactamase superfamily II)
MPIVMVEATDLISLGNGVCIWQIYDPTMKADLSSSAVKSGNHLFLVDPIPLAPVPLADLRTLGPVGAVLVTNANHPRAAGSLAQQLDARIFAPESSKKEFPNTDVRACPSGEIVPGLTAIPIEGAVLGEMVFHFSDGGGTLVVGDALINFEPHGFCLLPAKYCSNQRLMRASLRQLLEWPFERLLFAHGSPILTAARERLGALLR